MEKRFTPGPWHVEENAALWVENEDGSHVVATVERDLGAVLPPELAEAHANARLIAAAPAMAEALEDAETLIAGYWSDGGPKVVQAVLERIRAALAAARGEPGAAGAGGR